MQSLKLPQLIKFSVTFHDDGVLLSIWEPAPINDSRVRPFLFMAKYRLSTEDEAKEVLSYYREAYQSDASF